MDEKWSKNEKRKTIWQINDENKLVFTQFVCSFDGASNVAELIEREWVVGF